MENNAKNEQEIVQETKQDVEPFDYEKEIKRLQSENQKLKAATDNACKDANDWKNKFRATQTEAERKAAEQEEQIAAIKAENERYKSEKRISTYKSKLMESGYDAATAAAMAESLPDGITDDFFSRQKEFYEQERKRIMADALNKQPDLTPGISPSSQTAEAEEMQKLRRWFGL